MHQRSLVCFSLFFGLFVDSLLFLLVQLVEVSFEVFPTYEAIPIRICIGVGHLRLPRPAGHKEKDSKKEKATGAAFDQEPLPLSVPLSLLFSL